MKPSNPLIHAWHQFLRTRAEAKGARIKSLAMFRHAEHDIELHNRATQRHHDANQLDVHADVEFRKALKSVYCKRYRIEWKDDATCTVFIHEPYSLDESGLKFHNSLRLSRYES